LVTGAIEADRPDLALTCWLAWVALLALPNASLFPEEPPAAVRPSAWFFVEVAPVTGDVFPADVELPATLVGFAVWA
jgi:hypothetical protein